MQFIKQLLSSFRSRIRGPADQELKSLLSKADTSDKAGRVEHAYKICRRILRHYPHAMEAMLLCARIYGKHGRIAEARALCLDLIDSHPDDVRAHFLYGNILIESGDAIGARAAYGQALNINPDLAEAHYGLALASKQTEDQQVCAQRLMRAIELKPGMASAIQELANILIALIDQRHINEADELLSNVLINNPDEPALLECKGYLLQLSDDPAGAIIWYRRALELKPDSPKLWGNLATVLYETGAFDEAKLCYRRLHQIEPDNVLALWNQSLLYLIQGDYQTGWPLYEHRFELPGSQRDGLPMACWQGEDLTDRSVLIWAEQGLGDEIMFGGCLPDLLKITAKCIIECHVKLEKLYQRSFPCAQVLTYTGHPGPLPEELSNNVDFHLPVGSLPLYFRRSASDFSQPAGYLRADAERIAHWRDRLHALGGRIRIGISWRGGSVHSRQRLRSTPLPAWHSLLSIDGVRAVSLQYGAERDEIESFNCAQIDQQGLAYWPDAIGDYDETAALVCALDLVISVDTTVVHLAGALGQPVWVLVAAIPEWRYGRIGSFMSWYPSAVLFRQHQVGAWDPVFQDVATALAEAISASEGLTLL